jgi:4-diphosphocytidyl-2-C-methyl-D-erythritol kinase
MGRAAGAYENEGQPATVSTASFSLPAFAKINWSLHILGKRSDGYHEVSTSLQTISFHDDLHFSSFDDREICFSCDDPKVPTDETNLIVKAATSLRDRYRVEEGAVIHLVKRIPANVGLGGASSNAAVALVGLACLWDLTPTVSELTEIGSAIGADVPFFFFGGRALAKGTGTEVFPLPDTATAHLLVVKPNAAMGTAEAYKRLHAPALTRTMSNSKLSISPAWADLEYSDQTVLQNDFEPVIFRLEPEIERAKKALIQAGASGGLLAGSGSCVFGIFDSQKAQERALHDIQAEVGWRIFPCVTLSRQEYLQAMGSCGVPLLRSFNFGPDTGA